MKKIFFLGECMVELKAISDSTLNQSFAGDVYNSAVYLKRCFSSLECGVVSAIGTDALSIKMRQRFVEEGLATQLVFTHANKVFTTLKLMSKGSAVLPTGDMTQQPVKWWIFLTQVLKKN
jgi:sugar/nucleoside kinase (ribokinase family)